MNDIETLYGRFRSRSLEIAHINAAKSALDWDSQTMMPAKGADARSEVMGSLSALLHEKSTHPVYEETLAALIDRAGALDAGREAAVRLAWKRLERAKKLPAGFVQELAMLCSASQQVWAKARTDKDFAAFRPNLERLVGMKREEAEMIGYAGSAYDALLDEFEPGMTTATVARTLGDLRRFLTPFVARLVGSPHRPYPGLARMPAPRKVQEGLSAALAKALGFDLEAGRIDVSAHPFCSTFHGGDVRLTTRYDDADCLYSLLSVAHEAGHGMYEQGLPPDLYGTPAGEVPSMGLHESQSRLWENMVCKSKPFWRWLCAMLRGAGVLGDGSVAHEPHWRAVNVVTPSFIRTESDEVTYNLHICLRFEIECALIEGRLEVADAEQAWNAAMKDYLGLDVASPENGILQDIHWSCGAFGYFPTYSIGNLYSAQIFAAAANALPGLEEGFAKGEFSTLLAWLRDNIHRHGSTFSADETVRAATGSGLDAGPFKAYLERKYGEIYRL